MAFDLPPTTNFWAAYQAANPKMTPADVKLLKASIAQMPEHPTGLVRMMEGNKGFNGEVRTTPEGYLMGDPDIWVSRKGPAVKSKDPLKVAGTILHEDQHLRGASESEAREAQLKFLQGQPLNDDPYITELIRRLTETKAEEANGKVMRLKYREKR